MNKILLILALWLSCAPPATSDNSGASGGWLVVQTPPTGPLRCWEVLDVDSPCYGNYYTKADFEVDNKDVEVRGGSISCAKCDGNCISAYEALRVSPSDCWQSSPHDSLTGAL